MSKSTKKILEVWYHPVSIFILAFLLITFIATEHFYRLNDLKDSLNLFLGGFITLVTTFIGVFTPLRVQKKWDEQAERRKMIFAITAVWDELRANRNQLKNIVGNYQFESAFSSETLEQLLEIVEIRVNSLYELYKLVDLQNHKSMIGNLSISYLKNDDTYNNISNAYEDLIDSKGRFVLTIQAIKLRKYSLTTLRSENEISLVAQIAVQETKTKLDELKQSLDSTLEQVNKAICEIEKTLSFYGVKAKETEK